MVTTGWNDGGFQAKTEVLDLSIAEKFQCQDWPDYPMAVGGATIGLLGKEVLVCGGYDGTSIIDECYSINSKGTVFVTKMTHKRDYAASVNINEDTIWITGGWNGNYLSSSEFMTVEGSMAGPELPIPVDGHQMVAIDNELTMVIGGFSPGSVTLAQTFYYDHSNKQWVDGPTLNQARRQHAAGTVTDEVTMERLVVVSGGFDYSSAMKSTEILQDGDWSLGTYY